MKKLIFLPALVFACMLGAASQAQAGLNDLCSDKSFGLKVGSVAKDLGVGVEVRCTSPSYVFWDFDVDYSFTEKVGGKRGHFLAPAFGVGFDFVDVAGVEDLHPFLNAQALLAMAFFNNNFNTGPGFRFGLGADYGITDTMSAGVEYNYSHVYYVGSNTSNDGYSTFFARINFVY